MLIETIRRVITGVDSSGRSVFVSDEAVKPKLPPLLGGTRIWDLFGETGIPTVPNDGRVPDGMRIFPQGPGGHRFLIFTYPPESEARSPEDFDAALRESERLTPGISDAVTDAGGMHATATVDIEYVLAGEFTLTLAGGESRVLRAGDALVQCGTSHAWANKGDTPATMLLVFLGAHLEAGPGGDERGR